MERQYWIGRKRAAMGRAQRATVSDARLIHYQLAGLYSIRAAQSPPPFMLPNKGPATIGEGAVLQAPDAAKPRPRLWPKQNPKGKST